MGRKVQPDAQAWSDDARVVVLVRTVVRRVLGADDPEHDDALQSSFEHLIRACGEHRRGRSIMRVSAIIARNVAVDVLRARARHLRLFSYGDDADRGTRLDHAIDPERVTCARESLAQFAAALRKLPPPVADVVFAHNVLGQDLDEIATALGISSSAAQSRLFRGRLRLALLLLAEREGLDEGAGTAGPRPRVARTGTNRGRRAAAARGSSKTRATTAAPARWRVLRRARAGEGMSPGRLHRWASGVCAAECTRSIQCSPR